MENMYKQAILQIISQIMVGISVIGFSELNLGFWFLIPWTIGWELYRFSINN